MKTRIAELRKHKITQEELAMAVGVTATITSIEREKYTASWFWHTRLQSTLAQP